VAVLRDADPASAQAGDRPNAPETDHTEEG
jgi:hypothetical protein